MNAPQPILTARGLTKRYGRVTALDNADFDLMPGEILGVIGDNGAGKSTLIKALCGAVTPDHGEIELEGRPVHFRSPMEARLAGIETVYQNLALVAGAVDRRQHVPRARTAKAGHFWQRFPPLGPVAHGGNRARQAVRTRADDHPEHRPGRRDIVGRPAPGRGRGAGRGFRLEGRHHGRADGSARRQGIAPRARTDPRREEARPAYRVDFTQHAACLRGLPTASTSTGSAVVLPSSIRRNIRCRMRWPS